MRHSCYPDAGFGSRLKPASDLCPNPPANSQGAKNGGLRCASPETVTRWRARRVGRILAGMLAAAIFAGAARAHVVEQFYAESHESGIEVLFDVGYAKPEWRGDADQPPPTREWLVSRTPEQHAALRGEAERYLREHLRFTVEGSPVPVTCRFSDFDEEPPTFPKLLTGGAYYRISMEPRTAEPYELAVGENFPDLVVKTADDTTEGGKSRYLTLNPGDAVRLGEATAPEGAAPSLRHAFVQGFLHVVPEGLDHILFILAIFLLCRKWKPLLWQSLCFTAAHTLTLGLTASGVIAPSADWVEPVIALSIAALAVENFFVRDFRKWRLWLVFGFGLIHGMGFAGALAPVLGDDDGFLGRLVAANLGVEVAQIAVLALAWGMTWWHAANSYAAFRLAANVALAAVAMFWFAERVGWL